MGSVSGSVSERKPAISVPMREGTPAASTKSGATLVDLERQLEGALIEYERLREAWPKQPGEFALHLDQGGAGPG